jgi:hypothetical protein
LIEALCGNNVDIGRPEHMEIIFGRRVRLAPPGGYRTRLLRYLGRDSRPLTADRSQRRAHGSGDRLCLPKLS